VTFDADTLEWVFAFDGQVALRVSAPWRVVSVADIVVGWEDDGHAFGRQTPTDAKRQIPALVGSDRVTDATVDGHGDLRIRFGEATTLEVFNASAGYEGWRLYGPGDRYVVAQGGGHVVDSEADA
jgi:hypothetical protein